MDVLIKFLIVSCIAVVYGIFYFWGYKEGGAREKSAWQSELIERGHAHHCPDTGEWAWIGECGE
jgi:hypothetical protein